LEINETTKIPLFAAMAALPVVVGGIIWLTTIDSKASAAQEELRGLKILVIETRDTVIRIEQQLKDSK
jgi:hypothetical protein